MYHMSEDSGLGRATPPRRAPSPGMSSRHLPSPSGPGSLPPGLFSRRSVRHFDDNMSDISTTSSNMDYCGMSIALFLFTFATMKVYLRFQDRDCLNSRQLNLIEALFWMLWNIACSLESSTRQPSIACWKKSPDRNPNTSWYCSEIRDANLEPFTLIIPRLRKFISYTAPGLNRSRIECSKSSLSKLNEIHKSGKETLINIYILGTILAGSASLRFTRSILLLRSTHSRFIIRYGKERKSTHCRRKRTWNLSFNGLESRTNLIAT